MEFLQKQTKFYNKNNNNTKNSKLWWRWRWCHLINIIMTLATLMNLLQIADARHLHQQEDQDSPAAHPLHLPAWHANPYLGLSDSESDTDSSSSSSIMNSNISDSGDSSDSSSSDLSSDIISDNVNESLSENIASLIERHERDRLRLRLRRRRSHTLHYFSHVSPNDATPTWHNPCGGTYEPLLDSLEEAMARKQQKRSSLRKHLKALRIYTRKEYWKMRNETHQAIDIKDFAQWKYYRGDYKFLPTLGNNSNICLTRWYSDFQTYIGSFEALGRAHYNYDRHFDSHISDITHELHELLLSSRRVLCEIESTINASYPASKRADRLYVATREEMTARLNFQTQFGANPHPEVDTVDLKYAKHRYFHYMSRMWSILRQTHNKIPIDCKPKSAAAANVSDEILNVSSSSSSSSSASASAEHGVRNMQRRKNKHRRSLTSSS